jgi:hypothetical protein
VRRPRCGNQDVAHGAWAVGHPFPPRAQVSQVVLSVWGLCCLGSSVSSHRFPSLQLVDARFEGRLMAMMQQTLAGLLRIPRGQPRYPGQLCGRCGLRLCWSHTVSPPRVRLPRVLPSTGVPLLPRDYDPSDFLRVMSVGSLVRLGYRYFRPWKNAEALPRSLCCCWYMPCSPPPEGPRTSAHP